MRLWLGFWSALLVAASGWALVAALGGSRWIAFGISVPCLVVALVCAWLWWRARRRRTRGERAGDRSAPFERRARLRAALRVALRTLHAGLGPVGASRARRLPWYLLLGEPGSGKSAALAAAGFERVEREPAAEALIQLWCSKEAVCWEVATAVENDLDSRAVWAEMLDALGRARPRRPLDGILVAVSAERLRAEERPGPAESARRLRQRLDELAERLEVLLPVYLWITNVDALPDFEAFWGAAEAERRSRLWGATWMEWDGPTETCRSALARELGSLGSSLHAQALGQLCDRGASEPAAMLRFPRHFASLTKRLVAFAAMLGEDAPLRPRLLLRGLYLCAAGPQTAAPGVELRAFVSDLFARGIVPDRSLARRSQPWWRTQRRIGAVLLGVVICGALCAVLPALASYRQNLELIQATQQDTQATVSAASAPVSQAGAMLDPLLGHLDALEREAARFHVKAWWGAYEASALREAFAPLYVARLRATLTGPIVAQLAATLRAVSDVPALDWPGYRSAHDDLKLYLMLSEPERLDVPWASTQLLEVWERARQRGAYVGAGPLEPHVSRALAELQRSSLPLWTPDPEVVRTLRAHLLGLPVGQLESAWLEHAADGVPPVRAEQIFTGASARHWQARGEIQVPGVYTRAAWEKIRHRLDTEPPPPLDAWVLGESTSPMWGAEQLRSAYLERYARAWMDFLLQLRSQPPQNLEEAVDQLQSFSEAEGPITRLFQRLSENVRIELRATDELADRALAAAKAAADPVLPGSAKSVVASLEPAPVAPLEARFRGLLAFGFGDARGGSVPPTAPLAEYQNQLRVLLGELKDRGERASEADSESAALLEHAEVEVERLLAPLARNERAAIEDLLLTPIRGSLASARDRDAARLAEHWRSNVFLPEQALLRAYPFEPSSTEDATSAELARFFGAKTGTLWKFVDTELASRVTDASGHFAGRGAQGARLSEAFLRCLDVAKEMRDAWFEGESATPKVHFAVRLLPTEGARGEVVLSVDGESVSSAQNTDHWQPLEWSGAGAGPGAAIQIKGAGFADEIRRMGSFGLMRLLGEGAIRSARAGGEQLLEVTWQLNHRLTDVTVQFRPEAALGAFAPELFQRLRCPASPF